MKLNEQISRIKGLINELSPKSSGVNDFLNMVKDRPEIIKHLQFKDFKGLEDYVIGSSIDEFYELQDELEDYLKKKNEYISNEMDEVERAVQDLSRDGDIETTVSDVLDAFQNSKEVTLDKSIWSKLENTESNQIKKGEMNKVVELAKKYNKSSPLKLKKAIQSGKYGRPLILKFGDRYHLVAGNTRLCTAAAMGVQPKVFIGELK
jgi:hypothetical protein